MDGFFLVGVDIAKFWLFDGPKRLLSYFASLNSAYLRLFSVQVLLRSFFRPWKNEYRKGFVGVAIFVGIAIKSSILSVSLALFLLLLLAELVTFVGFYAWPFVTLGILFV